MQGIAIDFETANERPDSACAVGLAWIDDGVVTRRESRLIRPPTLRFSPGNIRVHGILPQVIRDRPGCAEVLAPFLPDLAGRIVLAHNAGFDRGVLTASLASCGRSVPDLSWLCTLQIARRVFPDPAGCGLAAVARRLGIDFTHHDAGEDADACARIALAAMRATGTACLTSLASRLGLPLGPQVARAPRIAPEGVAARALAAFAPPHASSPDLSFVMRGSRGDRYHVVVEERARLTLRCSCPAGRSRMHCRHVQALLDGEVTDLLSGNLPDVERLRRRIEAGAAMSGPQPPTRLVPPHSTGPSAFAGRSARRRWR